MKFNQVDKIVDVNSEYISQHDHELMKKMLGNTIFKGNFGAVVYTEDNPMNIANTVDVHAKLGFSENFLRIFSHASLQGIRYIRFDEDGGDVVL